MKVDREKKRAQLLERRRIIAENDARRGGKYQKYWEIDVLSEEGNRIAQLNVASPVCRMESRFEVDLGCGHRVRVEEGSLLVRVKGVTNG